MSCRRCRTTENRLHIYKRPCCTCRCGPRYEPLSRAPFAPRGWARSPPRGESPSSPAAGLTCQCIFDRMSSVEGIVLCSWVRSAGVALRRSGHAALFDQRCWRSIGLHRLLGRRLDADDARLARSGQSNQRKCKHSRRGDAGKPAAAGPAHRRLIDRIQFTHNCRHLRAVACRIQCSGLAGCTAESNCACTALTIG